MNILITGAKGMVGTALAANLKNIRDKKNRTRPALAPGGEHAIEEIYEYDIDSTKEELEQYCAKADFVFNLAGVNRPQDPEDFMKGNFGFASELLDTLKKHGNRAPIMLSSSIQATLAGRFGDSEYGRSKRAGEELFFAYAEETGTKVAVYRFPNLMGHSRPKYNSAVSTFCWAVANDEPFTVNDRSTELELLYIDDLVEGMFDLLEGKEQHCEYDGVETVLIPDGRGSRHDQGNSDCRKEPDCREDSDGRKNHDGRGNHNDQEKHDGHESHSGQESHCSQESRGGREGRDSQESRSGQESHERREIHDDQESHDGQTNHDNHIGRYCCVPVTHKVTLGEIVDLLEEFKRQPQTLMMPKMPDGSFAKKLYSLYLTYLPPEKFKYELKMNYDDRGSFTELVHTADCGQVSINISKPGITKGQHWHNSKWELFIVVSGHGLIQERNIVTGESVEFEVSGEKIEAVHMIPGWTHNIINLSETENLVTVMTCNEIFDPARPDTFYEPV